MKLFILAALLLTSTLTFAADRTEAFNTVCKSLYSESSKLSCMQAVKKFNYFDNTALKICSSEIYPSEIQERGKRIPGIPDIK